MFKNMYQNIIVNQSGFFDPIFHFIKNVWKEIKTPSSYFDTHSWLIKNPDVRKANINERKEKNSPITDLNSINKKNRNQSKQISGTLKNKKKFFPSLNLTKDSTDLTLYIHIGQGKTGTSFIQNFLDINRLKLAKNHGVLYPNFNSKNLMNGRCHNHAPWYRLAKGNLLNVKDDLTKLQAITYQNSIKKIILSNEAWELDASSIRFFDELLHFSDSLQIKTICYLRRVDFLVESAWKQWGLKEYENIEEYYSSRVQFSDRNQLTYEHLQRWSTLIGKKNIIVRPYEKQQLNNGLIYDFLLNIGIDFSSHSWDKTEDINRASNSGFNRDVLEILHYCRDLFVSPADNHLFDLFSALLGEKFKKEPFEPYTLLSPAQRFELLNKNQYYEQLIANEFMEREDGKIFYDPQPNKDEPWQPYEGLTLEKVIPIIIKMIDKNNQKIATLKEKKHKK